MFRRALAPAAVMLLATACSGRANDLDTYYDEPTSEVVAAPAVAPPATTTAPTTMPTTRVAPTTTAARARNPADAVLTADDLAAEGVQAVAGQAQAAEGCAVDASGHWRYPSGSRIEQTVALLPDAAGRIARMRDEGACLADSATDGPELDDLGEARHSWCYETAEARGCAAAIAEGGLLTVVTVEAGSTRRAGEAVARIAPLAAEALGRA